MFQNYNCHWHQELMAVWMNFDILCNKINLGHLHQQLIPLPVVCPRLNL
jgi:hypothetical protein